MEETLLERTDTGVLWSLHLSDLFCFTSLSNLIVKWSILPPPLIYQQGGQLEGRQAVLHVALVLLYLDRY